MFQPAIQSVSYWTAAQEHHVVHVLFRREHQVKLKPNIHSPSELDRGDGQSCIHLMQPEA